jgi:hypothetical protein
VTSAASRVPRSVAADLARRSDDPLHFVRRQVLSRPQLAVRNAFGGPTFPFSAIGDRRFCATPLLLRGIDTLP